ncbi:MAG: NADP-dependent oxidoreductase [Ktedonobacteraceae bacterium]|nr:NADP-dependent oxidoreductase [Ktedonobacteraceae bacterium]
MPSSLINAIQVHAYGNADQLKLERIPTPEPQAGEVLVRVHAAGVNPGDWKVREGWAKDFLPPTLPYVPGADLAGVVTKVGPGVTAFHPGQEVFGRSSHGSYAEYSIAPASTLALKPRTLSFDEAATVPVGATTAWQGLFEYGNLQPGQSVLILGGAGGVGLFAVQFARRIGARVISTTSTGHMDFVRELGAETVIDYTQAHALDDLQDVDLIFDTVGGEALEVAWLTLKQSGTLVSIADQPDEATALERGVYCAAPFLTQVSTELLNLLAHQIDNGQIKVAIAASFSLSEAAKAQKLSQRGHGSGRIILHIAEEA